MSYLSLDEAAAKLGISTDKLVELRSQGQVRGFKDGSSWKFPENEIERLADDLAADDNFGSGILVDEVDLGESGASIGAVIGGDQADDNDGSDVNLGSEPLKEGSTGSDVNLVTGTDKSGSDVSLVANDGGKEIEIDSVFETDEELLQEIDSAELKLDDPALLRDSADSIDVAIDPKEGSTGPVAKAEINEEVDKISISDVDVSEEPSKAASEEEFMLSSDLSEDDSSELLLADDSDSLDLDSVSDASPAGASSLALMNELDGPSTDKPTDQPMKSSGADVLSELDLLGEQANTGSGLISGDSEKLLTSSGLGSGLDSGVINEMDDALSEDDDLVIADDDADLMLDSVSDISVAGDSGINLMSPSDSGLSLESEPLDLAGSSLSALDLGAELADGSGIASGKSGTGSAADEEFQLSPSGVGLDADMDSSSQVIEVEDSEVVDLQADFGDENAFADAGFGDADAQPAGDAFGAAPEAGVAFDDGGLGADAGFGAEADAGDAFGADDEVVVEDGEIASPTAGAAVRGYEVPFSLFQCLSLMFIILVLSLGGMLMTDLVRNMWAYSETSAPVSSLTDSLISMAGLDS
ncbi:helix-turn-helix domain-containing protein [Roseiconus lacunae]|uniref:Helix-turn-helix domain-containing protein n=1 Tax=Roseiconus lacunae TaxID=2605694 RepID=A0ABT7PIM4_9BACT|nr:helix-turn-helix domain-containing protein [Roseiconus lacunae]MDM4016344.1 helix-turn-helix domain-containing protein [Roseiconus lacunae]